VYHFILNIICPRQTVQYLLNFCSATLLNVLIIVPFCYFFLWQLIMQLGTCIDLENAGFKVFLNCHMCETIKICSFANLMLVLKQASLLCVTTQRYHSWKMSSNQNIRKCHFIQLLFFFGLSIVCVYFTALHFT